MTGRCESAWRPLAWLLVVSCTLLAIFGISRLRIDDDLRGLIRDRGSGFALVDEVAAVFGPPDRDCVLHVTAHGGDIFAHGVLESLGRLCDELATVDGVEKVRSMFDVRRQGAAGAVLPVIPRTAGPLDDERRAEARQRTTAVRRYCSCDWRRTTKAGRLWPAPWRRSRRSCRPRRPQAAWPST